MVEKEVIDILGRDVTLTNLDKYLWPELKVTKYHLIEYYIKIYPYIKHHLADRPLVFNRYPDGIYGKSFYQKNIPAGAPKWVKRININSKNKEKAKEYVLLDHPSTLVWLANLACIEIHPWLSKVESLDNPDFVVFDLDPMVDVTFEEVKKTTKVIKKILDKLELRAYPKLSGSTGIQIFLPVKPQYSYQEVREFGYKIMKVVNGLIPETTTLERKVDKRGKKIYLDYMQNVKGKTISVVYGTRPLKNAPVSAPIKWKELDDATLRPDSFNIFNIFQRLEEFGDLFNPALTDKQEIDNLL